MAWVFVGYGLLRLLQGNYDTAATHLEEGLKLFQQARDKIGMTVSLERLAALASARGQTVRAVRLFGAAAELRTVIGWPRPPVDRSYYESLLAAARTQLDEATFATAWAEGRAMTLEQAIADALEDETTAA